MDRFFISLSRNLMILS